MSRCYPFPPPGYERKPRSDDVDLITKEKQKEKKHKKEKKDKEKREGKDRKEKNRSKDKRKEKKERKEKDKEKRRHKDRDKEKLPDGSNFEERIQGVNEEKFPDSSRKVEDVKYSKLAEELSERCQDNGASGRIHKDFNSSDRKAEGLGAWESLEKEIFHGNDEMAVNHINKNHNRSNGLSKDAEKKLQGSEKAREQPPLVINLVSRDNTKYDVGARTMHKELVKRNEERHEISEKNKMGGEKSQENQTRNNVLDQELEKLPGKPKQKDNNKPEKANLIVQDESKNEWQMSTHAAIDIGGSEKSEDKEVDGRKSNHHGNNDQTEKKHKKKDKDKRKKEKEAKRDRREKRGGKEHDKTKVVQEKAQVYTQDLATHKDNEKYVDIDENFRKRRYQEINGLLHEGDLRPSKLPKPLPSLPLHVENGRTVTLCGSASNKAGGMNCKIDENHSLNHVNHRINGTPSVGSRSSVAANASQKHEVSLKPPHPDTKYLNIIYSVPKIEEWPEADNQDWLFHKDGHWPKPKSDVKIDEPTTQVWSEALIIESPRVIALPYVIPF